jgi:hypothetical protein
MKSRCLLYLFVLSAPVLAFSLDREAFTFSNYKLDVRVEPDQQRLGVRGRITLRNDSQTAQKIAVLQISSSLHWSLIQAGGQPLQFVLQPFTSDIDHTGELSEAIVTLPKLVPPKATMDLDIGYEGVIVLDATRLSRLGAPDSTARATDWDQISANFTAVRGVGYVAWYPVATEAADLSEGGAFFDTVGRWKRRESGSAMQLKVSITMHAFEVPQIMFNDLLCSIGNYEQMGANLHAEAECLSQPARLNTPTIVIANYKGLDHTAIEVRYLPGHDEAAANFAEQAEKVAPFIVDWFGPRLERAKAADLPDANSSAFEDGGLLLMPLVGSDSTQHALAAIHQLTHVTIWSYRPWISEGLAHFSQALYLEREKGRPTALEYMRLHSSAFATIDKQIAPGTDDETARSLVNTLDEETYRSKAMRVWWMLRDMLGDQALKKAIASYHPEQDKEPSCMPRLIQAQTQKELEWFFDDWIYRDRGLPDFKIDSVFPRKTLPDGYMVTVTVSNQGLAGAEVPVTIKFEGGEITQRLVVRGKSSSVTRFAVPKAPEEVVVNDGSVPESDTTNNTFRVVLDDSPK